MDQPVFFPIDDKDLAFFRAITQETGNLFFRLISFHIIDREATVSDPLYGESKNLKFIDFNVRAQTSIAPKKAELTPFGLDEKRDLVVNVDVGTLLYGTGPTATGQPRGEFSKEAGGFPVPKIGDELTVDSELYKITEMSNIDYFAHQERNLTYSYACMRQRDRSVADTELVNPANPAGASQHVQNTEAEWFPGSEDEDK